MWLCGFYHEAFKFEYYFAPRSYVFFFFFFFFFKYCLALWSPRLGKREAVYMFLVNLYVHLACDTWLSFSLHFGVGGWLWLVKNGTGLTFQLTFLKVLLLSVPIPKQTCKENVEQRNIQNHLQKINIYFRRHIVSSSERPVSVFEEPIINKIKAGLYNLTSVMESRVRSPAWPHKFRRYWSWNNLYGHSHPSADRSRAVVSYSLSTEI